VLICTGIVGVLFKIIQKMLPKRSWTVGAVHSAVFDFYLSITVCWFLKEGGIVKSLNIYPGQIFVEME